MPVRAAIAATALSLVVPGTGHLYLGRASRFLGPLAGFVTVLLTLGTLGFIATLPGFIVVVALAASLMLFSVVDSAVAGLRSGRTSPKWYMRWFVLVAWALAIAGSVLLWMNIREAAFGYATYRIPGSYMRPTLAPGDVILVDTRMPAAGDLPPNTLVVFRHPESRALHVLRIKGESGPNTYSLSTGLPFAASLDGVPRANITGLVTALLWSPERRELPHTLR